MGSLRELVLAPLGQQLLKDLGSGDFGMVTNASTIRILNETDSLSEITGKLRITENSDLDNSLIDLSFDFFRNNPKGKPVKLAECELSTTWVTIEGRGTVKKSPLPGYFRTFLQEHISRNSLNPGQLNYNGYPSTSDLGKILFEEKNRIGHTILLHEHDFTTGMYDGNSVGNLYYSNYYRWQAEIIEQYFYGIIPGILKANGREGEFITVESSVQHLQEAMPFEVIRVSMYLDKIFENGFRLNFEYFSKDVNIKRKLAYGHNMVIFCKRSNSVLMPLACRIPESAFEQVMNRTHV
jgi:acyl-CoA thioesterase FadM